MEQVPCLFFKIQFVNLNILFVMYIRIVFIIISFVFKTSFLFSQNEEKTEGEFYAFLIGISDYPKESYWSPLPNVKNDIDSIAFILKEKYGAEIRILRDKKASRENIYDLFQSYSKIITEKDKYLVYYSGHGFYDNSKNTGYWVPVDAKGNTDRSVYSFISYSEILQQLEYIKSKHTFLMADACYSGSMFSTMKGNISKPIRQRMNLPSRYGITAGNLTTVHDGNKNSHSPFAEAFLSILKNNNNRYLTSEEVARHIQEVVPENAGEVEDIHGNVQYQQPQTGRLKIIGNQGGIFSFYNPNGKNYKELNSDLADSPEITEYSFRYFEEIKKSKRLVVGFSLDPPAFYYNENKIPQGFNYELSKLLGKELGLQVEIKVYNYGLLPKKLAKGDVDIVMSAYIADISLGDFYWSEEYLNADFCLIVDEGSPIRSISDLEGLRIGIWNEPFAKKWIKENIPKAKVRTYETTGWYNELRNGKIDAILNEYPFAIEELKHQKRMKIVKYHVIEVGFSFFMNTDRDLLISTNDALKKIIKSNSYRKLNKKYLYRPNSEPLINEDMTCKRTYTVKVSENLSDIAEKELGNPEKWEEIYNINKGILINPFLLDIGTVLCLPDK